MDKADARKNYKKDRWQKLLENKKYEKNESTLKTSKNMISPKIPRKQHLVFRFYPILQKHSRFLQNVLHRFQDSQWTHKKKKIKNPSSLLSTGHIFPA